MVATSNDDPATHRQFGAPRHRRPRRRHDERTRNAAVKARAGRALLPYAGVDSPARVRSEGPGERHRVSKNWRRPPGSARGRPQAYAHRRATARADDRLRRWQGPGNNGASRMSQTTGAPRDIGRGTRTSCRVRPGVEERRLSGPRCGRAACSGRVRVDPCAAPRTHPCPAVRRGQQRSSERCRRTLPTVAKPPVTPSIDAAVTLLSDVQSHLRGRLPTWPAARCGHRLGSCGGSPNDGSTRFSKRVMARMPSASTVRT